MTLNSIAYTRDVERSETGQFLPGHSYGTMRKVIEGALRRTVHQSPEKLRKACEQVLDDAANGETWPQRMAALTFIADRLDGKAVARIETSDGDARSLSLAEIVHAVLQARASSASDAEPASDPAQLGVAQEQEQR